MSKPQLQLIAVYVLLAVGVVGFAFSFRSLPSHTAGIAIPRFGTSRQESRSPLLDRRALQQRKTLLQDARAYVRQGIMSRGQYFEYTGEQY